MAEEQPSQFSPEESIEAKWLRENWNKEILGQYNNRWIAVLGQKVISASDDLNFFYHAPRQSIEQNPLIAYVTFDPIQ